MEVVTPDECAVAIEMDPNLVSGVALGTEVPPVRWTVDGLRDQFSGWLLS